MMVTAAVGLSAVAVVTQVARSWGVAAGVLSGGVVFLAAGVVAGAVAVVAKWVLVGRIGVSDQPLWSSFVWRNELADNFVELVAAPWFAETWLGTAALNVWHRAMGSRVGRGVWCETYWLPEADLVVLGDASTVNRGCVVQTHLFHDRVMSMDVVRVEAGATLGPQGVRPGPVLFDLTENATSGTTDWNPPQMFAFLGTNNGAYVQYDGTRAGMTLRNLWVGNTPRPLTLP